MKGDKVKSKQYAKRNLVAREVPFSLSLDNFYTFKIPLALPSREAKIETGTKTKRVSR